MAYLWRLWKLIPGLLKNKKAKKNEQKKSPNILDKGLTTLKKKKSKQKTHPKQNNKSIPWAVLKYREWVRIFIARITLLSPATPPSPKPHLFCCICQLTWQGMNFLNSLCKALSDFRDAGSIRGTKNSQEPPVAVPPQSLQHPRAALETHSPLRFLSSQILQAKCFSSSPCL